MLGDRTIISMRCHFDGACEPINPGGNMGIGAFAAIGNTEIFTHSEYVPANKLNSNNVAEYKALIEILKFLIIYVEDNKDLVSRIDIRGDSKLVVFQVNDLWRIKSGLYVQYAKEAKSLFIILQELCNKRIIILSLKWVPREMNGRADELSKSCMIKNNCEFKLQKI